MRELWARLERSAGEAGLDLRFHPPATAREIDAAERTMGLTFPEDLRASLLVHDGQEPAPEGTGEFAWLPGHEPLARLEAMVAQWNEERVLFEANFAGVEPAEIEGGRLYHFLWHPKRIPIAGNPWWDQDNTYVDCFPAPAGTYGQLVMFGKGCFGQVHGPGLRATLQVLVAALESGEWRFREGHCVRRAKAGPDWAKYVEMKIGRKTVA